MTSNIPFPKSTEAATTFSPFTEIYSAEPTWKIGMASNDVTTGTYATDVDVVSRENSAMEIPPNLAEKLMVQSIFGPIMLTIVLFGLMGNVLSIVVMSTKSFRSTAISRPIRCLALSDSLYLLCIINSQPWFSQLIGLDIRSLSPISCQLFNWTTRSTAIFSAWMVILLAAERFFAVWFFEMVRRVFSVKTMTLSILVVVLITAIFNAVWTVHSDAVLGGRCVANARDDELTKQFLAACVFLYVGIPAPLLLILNLLIIVRLQLHSRNNLTQAGNKRVPQHRVTAMLLAVTTVFILFVPPIALCHMVAQFLGQNLFATIRIPLFIVGQTAQLLFVLNCAVNFYLYVVMGSTFRNKLISLLCGRCRGVQSSASSGSGKSGSNNSKKPAALSDLHDSSTGGSAKVKKTVNHGPEGEGATPVNGKGDDEPAEY